MRLVLKWRPSVGDLSTKFHLEVRDPHGANLAVLQRGPNGLQLPKWLWRHSSNSGSGAQNRRVAKNKPGSK
jgi:hypothetical protein